MLYSFARMRAVVAIRRADSGKRAGGGSGSALAVWTKTAEEILEASWVGSITVRPVEEAWSHRARLA